MKGRLKFLEEVFVGTIIWPVLGFGVFYLLTEILRFPLNWWTLGITLVMTFYLGIRVGIGERI